MQGSSNFRSQLMCSVATLPSCRLQSPLIRHVQDGQTLEPATAHLSAHSATQSLGTAVKVLPLWLFVMRLDSFYHCVRHETTGKDTSSGGDSLYIYIFTCLSVYLSFSWPKYIMCKYVYMYKHKIWHQTCSVKLSRMT